jgi:hypothetical protein
MLFYTWQSALVYYVYGMLITTKHTIIEISQ